MDALWLDVCWALRALRKRPLASFAVMAILASAIAAATVLGSLFTAIVYDVPPVESPETIARVWRADATRPAGHREGSASDFLAWQDAAKTLTALTAWSQRQGIVGGADGRTVPVLSVTSAPPTADPRLAEQHGSPVPEQNRGSNRGHRRRENDQPADCTDHVEESLRPG